MPKTPVKATTRTTTNPKTGKQKTGPVAAHVREVKGAEKKEKERSRADIAKLADSQAAVGSEVVLPAKVWKATTKAALRHASKDKGRPILNSVNVVQREDGVELVSTDSFTLHSQMIEGARLFDEDGDSALLSRAALQDFNKKVMAGGTDVELRVEDDKAYLSHKNKKGDQKAMSRLVEGDYPNYENLFDMSETLSCEYDLDSASLTDALESARGGGSLLHDKRVIAFKQTGDGVLELARSNATEADDPDEWGETVSLEGDLTKHAPTKTRHDPDEDSDSDRYYEPPEHGLKDNGEWCFDYKHIKRAVDTFSGDRVKLSLTSKYGVAAVENPDNPDEGTVLVMTTRRDARHRFK